MNEEEFKALADDLQSYVNEKDKKDFSEYALSFVDNPYHQGTLKSGDTIFSESYTGSCGDTIRWYIDIQNESIKQIFYKMDGCVTSGIAASQTAKMVDQKSITEARLLTAKHVLDALGKFPKENHHCASLTVKGLNLTLDKYELSKDKK